jgi:predicted DNA repair protein MutK
VKKQKMFANSVQTSATNVRQNVGNIIPNIARSVLRHVKNVRKNAGKWRHSHIIEHRLMPVFFSTLIQKNGKQSTDAKNELPEIFMDDVTFICYNVCCYVFKC